MNAAQQVPMTVTMCVLTVKAPTRLFHIMLLKLPIMLFSNAAECSLLCLSLLFHVMLTIKSKISFKLVSFVIL